MDIKYDQEIKESEKAVLASLLYHYREIETIVDIDTVNVDQFFTKPAQRIFQAIKNTSLSDGKYEVVDVLGSLKKVCVNSKELDSCVAYLNTLPEDIYYFSVNKYLQILHAHKVKRDLDSLALEISKENLDLDNFDDAVEGWKNKFTNIVSKNISNNYTSARDAVEHFNNLVLNSKKLGSSNFLKTHYIDVDRKIKALSGGQLVIIASRPGVGKTTFALNLIYNNFKCIAKTNKTENTAIGIFSLEMPNSSLLSKLLAIDAGIELNKVQKLLDGDAITTLEAKLIEKSKKKISDLNLLFCDESNITIGRMISTIKSWCREYKPKLIIIDYLQLINVVDDKKMDLASQYQRIGMISRNLKILSMEMNICILALAQLNRKAEERRGSEKSPILSDLRESGSIEQDADVVMFLYEEKDNDPEAEKTQDEARERITMLKVAKNRHGPVGKVEFYFNKVFGTYKVSK